MDAGSRELLDAALADKEKFAAIVERSEAMVYSLALGFFRNRAVAEDLAQETYLDLFRNLHKLDSDLHVTNWLRLTVTRKCIDRTRRKKERPHLELHFAVEPSVDHPEPDPVLAQELGQRVAELPAKMRAVVLLRFQEDMRLSEIAETMNIPVNTAKTLLRRALIRLRPKVEHLRGEVCLEPAGR